MFSIKAREAMCIYSGMILGFLASFWALDIFGWSPDTSSFALRLGTIIFFLVLGIVAGVAFEKMTRARYLAAIEKNPAFQARMEKASRWGFKFGSIIAAAYLVFDIWAFYELFKNGIGLSSADQSAFVIRMIFEGIFVVVLLWLALENGSQSSAPGIKKLFLRYAVFFFVLALINALALVVLRSNPPRDGSVLAPQSIVNGQGELLSLGTSSSPLGEVSAVIPVGFQSETLSSGQAIIQETTSPTLLSPSYVTALATSTNLEVSVNTIENGLNALSVPYVQATTTFLDYQATTISFTSGKQQGFIILFMANGFVFEVGTSNTVSSPNPAIDAIVASMTIATSTPASVVGDKTGRAGSVIQLGTSSAPLAEISVRLLPGTQMDPSNPGEVIINAGSDSNNIIDYMTISATSTDVSLAVNDNDLEKKYASWDTPGVHYNEKAGLVAGYPAYTISYIASGTAMSKQITATVFEANDFVFTIYTNEIFDPVDSTDKTLNDTLEQMIDSIQVMPRN